MLEVVNVCVTYCIVLPIPSGVPSVGSGGAIIVSISFCIARAAAIVDSHFEAMGPTVTVCCELLA